VSTTNVRSSGDASCSPYTSVACTRRLCVPSARSSWQWTACTIMDTHNHTMNTRHRARIAERPQPHRLDSDAHLQLVRGLRQHRPRGRRHRRHRGTISAPHLQRMIACPKRAKLQRGHGWGPRGPIQRVLESCGARGCCGFKSKHCKRAERGPGGRARDGDNTGSNGVLQPGRTHFEG
jgi:hypothetical protein